MTVTEVSAIVAAVIFAGLAAAMIRTLRKMDVTLAEARQLLNKMDGLVDDARQSMDQASVFFEALEDIGYQAGRLREMVLLERRKVFAGMRGLMVGVRTAAALFLERAGHQGGHNGRENH
jgi:uncharacterized protein YoxC